MVNIPSLIPDFIAFCEKAFKPIPELKVWEWCEKNINLSRRISPHPGPYRTDWCAYVREPQEAFTDPLTRDIILCWATRSSKTETMMNCLRYTIGHDPQSILIVQPTETIARSFSESRFQASVDESPILAAEKPDNLDKYKLLEMHFKQCSVWIVGSNSPANLSGRGVTILFGDEIDKWPEASKKEAGSLELALERTKDRWNRKHLLTSTPTLEGGQIWREFKMGDQRYYFVPCPHCEHFQTLKIKQVRWPEEAKNSEGEWQLDEVKKNTWYECENCSGKITDSQKPKMIRNGEWRATAKNKEPGRRSYHLNSLYPEWISFGEVSVMFLQSKTSTESLKRFVNSWLAEPFFEYGNQEEFTQHLEKTKTEIQVNTVPSDHRVLITADVQIDRLYFVARAWSKNKESVLMDYGMLPGFEELVLVSKKWKATCGFIDSAFRPQIILEFCGKNQGWIPTLGSPLLYTPMRWTDIPIDGGLMKGRVIKTLRYRANDWKETLNERIQGKGTKWAIPQNIGDDYKKQMAGEHRVEKKAARGVTIVEWIKHGANHYWDCEVIQTVGFEAVRPLMFEVETMESAPPQISSQASREMEDMRPRNDEDLWNGTKSLTW